MGLFRLSTSKEKSEMNLTTIAVHLAKDVVQVGVADHRSRIVERHRLTRSQFERFIRAHKRSLWVMEACGGAHHWARTLIGLGHEAKLLPPA
jgi:transposase